MNTTQEVSVQEKLEDMKLFLGRFREFSKKMKNLKIKEFQGSFENLASGIRMIQGMVKKYEREFATQFNIFNVLGVGSKEVKTHSAILANFLSPCGSHGQGDLFLICFLGHLNELLHEKEMNHEGFSKGDWVIEKEKVTTYGNLDLVLIDRKKNRAIVIENKIYAADQINQLDYYYGWLKKSPYDNNGVLVYLTINGTSSSQTQLKEGQYLCIGYKKFILNWLLDCMKINSAPRIRDVIVQYLELIKFL